MTKDQLESAPKYADDDDWNWSSQEYIGLVDSHYRPMNAFI